MQFTPQSLSPQLYAIARASQRMVEDDAATWHSRLELCYGEMEGQRRVDFDKIAPGLPPRATIIALETLYLLVAVLISTSAFASDPARQLRESSRLSKRQFASLLRSLVRGNLYDQCGIRECRDVCPLDWLADDDTELHDQLRELFRLVAECWDGTALKFAGDDPMQEIHRQLFPVNLMHITGQFYSPPWLAELCLEDVGWQAGQTLIDPFCGSGVFLVTALRIASREGVTPGELLSGFVGIDSNPFAVAATRANLALFVARNDPRRTDPIDLDVRCADAIAPSIRKGRPGNASHSAPVDHQDECKADVVATNPPWVGWEYLSRPYRDLIEPAWTAHDLYRSRGMEASFLKEDLSNVALLAAWDAYLHDGGRSVVVLRPSTMHSEVASRGVRRLSIRDGGTELRLEHIRTFDGISLFKSAGTAAATWVIRKGESTRFPVPVTRLEKTRPRWNPRSVDSLSEIRAHVRETSAFAEPTDPSDASSRWMIAPRESMTAMRKLRGSNKYTPRMGVFTGGANGVYYLQRTSYDDNLYRNLTARSRRPVREMHVEIENELVYPVARGRDVGMWTCQPKVLLLMPHTTETRMYPIPSAELTERYPNAHRYLSVMKPVLTARNGFAGWEKKIHRDYFYSLQRIGAYTFAPYKVCWRYIASELTVCVLGRDDDGKIIVPNDKVMFIPMNDADEAWFVAGFLSSESVRRYIGCIMEKRQISTRVIKSLAIPDYDPDSGTHQSIRNCCRRGHDLLRANPEAEVGDLREEIDRLVASIH